MSIASRIRADAAIVAFPLAGAVAVLALFTVPNYLHARQWTQRADSIRTSATQAATRHDDYRALQGEVDRLQRDLKARNKAFPLALDKGRLLESLSVSGANKGIVTSESRAGTVASVAVPGVPGGKAARRQVDAQMTGSFDALFGALSGAEHLDTLVTVRSVEFTRAPGAAADAPIEAHFQFDEYFDEGVVVDKGDKTGKAGAP